LVSAFYQSLRRFGGHRSLCASTGLRSFLRVVSTDHAVNLGATGKEISRSRHDRRV